MDNGTYDFFSFQFVNFDDAFDDFFDCEGERQRRLIKRFKKSVFSRQVKYDETFN